MTEKEGRKAFQRAAPHAPAGSCVCGRKVNVHGKVCCRSCQGGYGSHSKLCAKRNNL